MKRLLMFLLLAFALTVFAQQQSTETQSAESADELVTTDCEIPVDADGEPTGEPLAENCVQLDETIDPLDEYTPEPPPEPDDAALESNPDDEDFTPGEEISEDYPVPLPSDI